MAEISFEIYNEEAVRILKEEDPDLLPDYSVNSSKDLAYNKKQVTNAITSGIIKGESIPKIAANLQSTIENLNESSAVSAARTAAIAAQNTGSLSAMKRLAEMGVEVQKEWVATLDSRTRASHRALDGQRRDLDEAFSNGLQYPGASGDPAERWNCRCKIKAYMPKYDSEDEPRLTYSEWAADKKTTGRVYRKANDEKDSVYNIKEENLLSSLSNNRVKYNKVSQSTSQLTERQIINIICQDDKTDGSCISTALAYCGRIAGYDVTDFRGGVSLWCFAKNTYNWIKNTASLKTAAILGDSAYDAALTAIKKVQTGNQYVLMAGVHTAIIQRAGNGKLQYLELQDEDSKGWNSFIYKTSHGVTTVETLIDRFGCNKSDWPEALLTNVENFKNVEEFAELLGYLNTEN